MEGDLDGGETLPPRKAINAFIKAAVELEGGSAARVSSKGGRVASATRALGIEGGQSEWAVGSKVPARYYERKGSDLGAAGAAAGTSVVIEKITTDGRMRNVVMSTRKGGMR